MKKKIIWFTADNVTAEMKQVAHSHGAVIRDPRAYKEGDFLEKADAVAGKPPKAYLGKCPLVDLPFLSQPKVREIVVPEHVINEQDKVDVEAMVVGQTDAKAIDGMTVDELQAYLSEIGVEFDPKAKKADLVKLAKGQ